MIRRLQEALFELAPARWMLALALLCRATVFRIARNRYGALCDFCWVFRVSRVQTLRAVARRTIFDWVDADRSEGGRAMIEAYLSHPDSAACASLYSVSGLGSSDLFRDLIVLKKAMACEKGVILLKYDRTFDAVISLLDLPRLMQRYTFVLEPSWAGYCAPSILMFASGTSPVFVQCFTEDDERFVADLGFPLVPVRLGPADWVDADLFGSVQTAEKTHDIIMVANWARHKRHAVLFHALRGITDRQLRVLLVGFPWAGRTADDIRREARSINNTRVHIDILEKLSQRELAYHLGRSRVFVFLSRKEGDNKALVEAMFADVPAIVFDRTVGGARRRINPKTGVLTSDSRLAPTICRVLDHPEEFAPREWIREHSGSAVATRVLDKIMRDTVTAHSGRYTTPLAEKTNAPNLTYKDPRCKPLFDDDYQFILSCRRQCRSGTLKRGAVA